MGSTWFVQASGGQFPFWPVLMKLFRFWSNAMIVVNVDSQHQINVKKSWVCSKFIGQTDLSLNAAFP